VSRKSVDIGEKFKIFAGVECVVPGIVSPKRGSIWRKPYPFGQRACQKYFNVFKRLRAFGLLELLAHGKITGRASLKSAECPIAVVSSVHHAGGGIGHPINAVEMLKNIEALMGGVLDIRCGTQSGTKYFVFENCNLYQRYRR